MPIGAKWGHSQNCLCRLEHADWGHSMPIGDTAGHGTILASQDGLFISENLPMFHKPLPAYVLLCLPLALMNPVVAEPPGVAAVPNTDESSSFAKSNLHVWAFEEYDSTQRTPQARARLLKELGITKAGYICRNPARVAEFDQYVRAYQKEGIELIAVRTPVNTTAPLEEPHISEFLKIVDRHRLQLQWWLTLEDDFDAIPEERRVDYAVDRLRPLVAEANRRACRLVTYGHGSTRWFTQAENQIAIIDKLKTE